MSGLKIKVMIVDDSLVFREIMARGIASDPSIVVVAKAINPYDARDKIIEFQPDVMICDIEMPGMTGIEFIKKLLPQYHLPVIVVSSMNEAVLDALNAGAVDFVVKPDVQFPQNIEDFLYDLIGKIKIAAHARVRKPKEEKLAPIQPVKTDNYKILAIGASTGGTEAIYQLLSQLPPTVPGILIVQHIPPMFSRMFAERLNHQTRLKVKEAQTGDLVEQGKVLISPGDQHMKVKRFGDNYKVEVFYGDKVNGHCPSVDVLFDSVAKEAGKQAIGIMLTGMGYDGAKGLLSMRRRGARTIGQDEKSSVVYGMPKVAYEIGAIEKQTDLSNIPNVLKAMLR